MLSTNKITEKLWNQILFTMLESCRIYVTKYSKEHRISFYKSEKIN